MIYIENLCEFIRRRIEEGKGGLYFPQNREYTTTSRMVQEIAAARGKRVRLLKILNPLVALASHMPGRIGAMANKAFGSLTIDMDMSGDVDVPSLLAPSMIRYSRVNGVSPCSWASTDSMVRPMYSALLYAMVITVSFI